MTMAGPSSMALSSYNPTDVLVLVGGQLFRAHRCILATNSGYFKSLLDADVGHASLSLPGLPSRAFSVLLDFMYSGHLAATGANIYEVLLCAQFLHMPRAIDLCKAYLVHQQQQQELSVNATTPPSAGPLHWLTLSPFIYKAWLADGAYSRCLNSASGSRPPTNILRPIPTKRMIAPLLPTFHKTDEQLCGATALSYTSAPCPSQIALTRVDVQAKANSDMPFKWTRPDFSPAPSTSEILAKAPQVNINERQNAVQEKETKTSGEKATPQLLALAAATVTSNVVIDIACCDGPVQFQRVINENYGLVCTVGPNTAANFSGNKDCSEQGNSKETQECAEGSESSALSSYANKTCASETSDISGTSSASSNLNLSPPPLPSQRDAVSSETHDESATSTLAYSASAATPGCFPGHSSSEGSGWTDSDNDTREHAHGNTGETPVEKEMADAQKPGSAKMLSLSAYHCIYCNHTFKSRYCYQKHKQRHINPKAFAGPATKPKHKEATAPLDMNVPFYPCKTCGSKFPSYYFVHKHRKLCHCDEHPWTDDSNTSSNTPEKD